MGSPDTTTERPQKDPVFGYLSMLESDEHGFFGGYLVVSQLGRPLEFHCTAPVRPSRAQQILYGPTLQPYLLGEQIGGTLLAQAKLRPNLILTDQFDAFCLRSQIATPMVCLAGANEEAIVSELGEDSGGDAPQAKLLASRRFVFGGYHWELPGGYEYDQPSVVELLQLLARQVTLSEPFGRIREAIQEAQRIGGRSQDAHGQAA